MKKKICLILSLLVVTGSAFATNSPVLDANKPETVLEETDTSNVVTVIGNEAAFMYDNQKISISQKAHKIGDVVYMNADEMLPKLGYTLGWDNSLGALTCTKDGIVSYVFPTLKNIWVGTSEYVFDETPVIISQKLYISEKMFETLTSTQVEISGEVEEYKNVTLVGKELYCTVNGSVVMLSDKAYTYNSSAYLPMEDVLPAMGFSISWDSSINAVSCTKNGVVSYVFPSLNNIWVGPTEYVFDKKPVVISSKTYIPVEMFKTLTGYEVTVSGELEEYKNVTLIGDENYCLVNDIAVTLSQKAYKHNARPYLPLEDILPAMGYTVAWDSNINAVSCTKNGVISYVFPSLKNIWVGPVEYVLSSAPVIISSKTYVSDEMFAALTGSRVTVVGELSGYKSRNSIAFSKRSDAHRLAGNSVVSGNGVTVVDGFGMELVSLSAQSAKIYADLINSVAASLDKDINVYNIIVPTAAEYYAPSRMYPNQLAGIRTVYANLSDRVTPINVYDILAEHAGEKIYFKTDHHWTQRGAYYAYKEFMAYQDVEIPSIDTFENFPSNTHVGSFASFARGTYAGTIMNNSPELLERFMPKYASTGTVYYNQYMTGTSGTVQAVNKYTDAYHNFIGGDNPITIFNTSAPSDKTLVIIKESFGNAFATWALNDYKKVCVIDPRKFNGFDGHHNTFNLNQFCNSVGATDVLFINYPIAAASAPIRASIQKMR